MIISTEKRVIYDNIVSGSGDIFPLSSDDFVEGELTMFFEWLDAVSSYELMDRVMFVLCRYPLKKCG